MKRKYVTKPGLLNVLFYEGRVVWSGYHGKKEEKDNCEGN
jgi:hypothetical protein